MQVSLGWLVFGGTVEPGTTEYGAGWQPNGLRRQEERRLQFVGPRTPILPTKTVTLLGCNFVEAKINEC
jgi:hypothetical protein